MAAERDDDGTHQAQLIWNRATGTQTVGLLEGDWLLSEVLRIDGYVMNGGVFHAVHDIPADELAEAIEAYRYFGSMLWRTF